MIGRIEDAALMRALFTDMRDAVIATDANRVIMRVNPAAEALLGYSEAELVGEDPRKIYASSDDYRDAGAHRFNAVAQADPDNALPPYRVRYRRKDGTEFISETVGTALRDAHGQVQGFLCIMRDVTEAQTVDQTFSDLYAITTDQSLSREEKINAILTRGCQVFDLPYGVLSRIAGQTGRVRNVCSPDGTPEPGQTYQLDDTFCREVVARDGPFTLTHASRSALQDVAAQTVLGFETYIGAPVIVNGTRYGILSFSGRIPRNRPFSDVERRFVQLFAQWIGQELASALHLAALEDARREANLLREKAEAANSAKSRFLANMSHEIRTPMNAVLGMAQLLARSQITDKQRDYVEAINASGRALLRLIDDVLDLSLIEAGRLRLNSARFDLTRLGGDCLDAVRGSAEAKGLTLNLDAPTNAWAIGDEARIGQMIINLLGNAIKFTNAGAVTLRLRIKADRVRIEVEDTGPGVQESDRERIFERFAQSNDAHTREHDGAGLGLSIVSEIVELHGGHAGVRPADPKGAVFWVDLPQAAAQGQSNDNSPALPTEAPRACCKRTVIAIEDDPPNRAILEETVRGMGWRIRLFADGEQALNSMREDQAFDAVITDFHMPRQSGVEVIERAQADRLIPAGAPILFLTADMTPEARSAIAAVPGSRYLAKPVDIAALQALLEELVCGEARAAG